MQGEGSLLLWECELSMRSLPMKSETLLSLRGDYAPEFPSSGNYSEPTLSTSELGLELARIILKTSSNLF